MNMPSPGFAARPHVPSPGGRFAGGALAALVLVGCTGIPSSGERRARQDLETVGAVYRPLHERPTLPTLQADSGLGEILQFAILNHPQVAAAYHDWAASVQRIALERSLPDPRLIFSADVGAMVTSLMPGLMVDFPGAGKREAAANIATAESNAKYFNFEAGVLQAAAALKKAYHELHFLEAKIGVNRDMLRLVAEVEALARAQNEAGKVSLQDVLRAQIEQERLTTEIANLEDSRRPMLAQFKAALGLKADDEDPPVPQRYEPTPLDLTPDAVFATALRRNPRLKAMEAEVRRADASLRLAFKARVPDFSFGLEADLKTSPLMVRPQASITLPIWRDKTAAQIAAAQADKQAAESRLSAEEIALAVEFAEKSFLLREASRRLELFTTRLLPKARQSLDVARSGYVAGKSDFLNLLEAERTWLEFQSSTIDARVQRELALAELSLLVLGLPPSQPPVLRPMALREKE
jgi:outer membrane protein, heavy metal efflux system